MKRILCLILCFSCLLFGCQKGKESEPDTTGQEVLTAVEATDTASAESPENVPAKTDTPSASPKSEKTTTKRASSKEESQKGTPKPAKTPSKAPQATAPQQVEEKPLLPVPTTNRPLDPNKDIQVTLLVECRAAINWGIFDKKSEFIGVLPSDGVMLQETLSAKEGDNVLATLKKALKKNRIAYHESGGYVSSIGGLSQMDCGGRSGWMYSVNGIFPDKSSNQYYLQDGDQIVFTYVC